MKLIYLKSALKCDSFDVTIGIKIPFFRVSVTIEPGRSLLQFVTTNCLILSPSKFLEIIFFFCKLPEFGIQQYSSNFEIVSLFSM